MKTQKKGGKSEKKVAQTGKVVALKPKFKNQVKKIVKRSGRVVPFDQKKVTIAIGKALAVTKEGNNEDAKRVSDKVVRLLNKNYKKGYIPAIEELQDLVERVLMILDFDESLSARRRVNIGGICWPIKPDLG